MPCDHDPQGETVLRQLAAPISAQSHPDDEWTIDALHGHMEHLFGEEDEFSKASADAIAWCVERIEALTTSISAIGEAFGCHPDSRPQEVAATVIKRAEELKAGALAELTAENARLKADVIDLSDQLKLEETCRIMREIEDEDELRRLCARDDREADMQELANFGQQHQPETYATTDHDWYDTHRAKVEAAHAATKPAVDEAAFAAVVERQVARAEADPSIFARVSALYGAGEEAP